MSDFPTSDFPTTTAPTAQHPTTQQPLAPQKPRRLPVRVGTIVWGGILLLIAALARAVSMIDPDSYTVEFVVWSVIGFGGLLIIGGIVGAIVRLSTRENESAGHPID